MNKFAFDKFPMGFWSTVHATAENAGDPAEWAEMGMTLTMGYSYRDGVTDKADYRAMLDCARQNGVQIILCDSRIEYGNLRRNGLEQYKADVAAAYKDWGDHPAVWGAHIGDEPQKAEYPYFVQAIRALKEIAPTWQPYGNLLPWCSGDVVGFDNWDLFLDDYLEKSGIGMLSYDCYTQLSDGPDDIPYYFNNLLRYGKAAKRHRVPFFTCLLCVPHFKYRQPTIDDIRWQLNTAVAFGAKGINWFFLHQQEIWNSNYRQAPINQLGRKTQLYDDIWDVQNIFRRTIEPYMLKLNLEAVYHVGKAYGVVPPFEGDEEIGKPEGDHPMVMSYFSDPADAAARYVLLVNNSQTESVQYPLTIKGKPVKVEILRSDENWINAYHDAHDNGGIVQTEDGLTIPRWMAPGQAILIRYWR